MTQQGLVTTPFGRRTLSLGLIATQQQARAVEPSRTVHKWKVFQAITEAKDKLGLPDRAIAVLSALLSFHQETTLTAGDPLIVFPSNEKLCQRAHGIAPATLRRHLAGSVEAGIVIRRDSPNGKRYARRGMDGEVSLAFGFELTPLVARAEEFEALAAEVQSERRAEARKERITLARRGHHQDDPAGHGGGASGDWQGLTGNICASGVSSAPRALPIWRRLRPISKTSPRDPETLELFTDSKIQAPMSPIPSATNRIQNQTFENLNLLSRKTGATSASPILRPMVQLKRSRRGRGGGGRNPAKFWHPAADGARGLPGYPRLHRGTGRAGE